MSYQDRARYKDAMHAVQSGVAMAQENGLVPESFKHLRVGICSAQVTDLALGKLLLDKGLITIDEYDKYVADAAEAEKEIWEAKLSDHLNTKVTLA